MMPFNVRHLFWSIICILAFRVLICDAKEVGAALYISKNCPVTFAVPSDLELQDIIGWTDPADKIVCRISVTNRRTNKKSLPEKSFDDVEYLSDVVLYIKNIPLKARLSEMNFVASGGEILYKGEALTSDVEAIVYEDFRIAPIEHYAVEHGDIVCWSADFCKAKRQERSNQSFHRV
jgi:hypothetical protein